jgi:hypothetical protein
MTCVLSYGLPPPYYDIPVRMFGHNVTSALLKRLLGVTELAGELRCTRHHLPGGKGVKGLTARRMIGSKVWMWHFVMLSYARCTRSHSCLRYYVTSRKVAGSIPDENIEFFNWPNPSSRTMALWSTQLLIEMSTTNIPGANGRPALKADFTAICEPTVWKNVGASTSHNLMGLHGLFQGQFFFFVKRSYEQTATMTIKRYSKYFT